MNSKYTGCSKGDFNSFGGCALKKEKKLNKYSQLIPIRQKNFNMTLNKQQDSCISTK